MCQYPEQAIKKRLHSQGRKLGQKSVAHLTASTSTARMQGTLELLIKKALDSDAYKGFQKRELEAICKSCADNPEYLAGPDAVRVLRGLSDILPGHGDQHLLSLREHIDAFCLAHPYRALLCRGAPPCACAQQFSCDPHSDCDVRCIPLTPQQRGPVQSPRV